MVGWLKNRVHITWILLLIIGVCICIIRAMALLAELDKYDYYIGDDVIVSATVDGDPGYSQGLVTASLSDVELAVSGGDSAKLEGKIWVSIKGAKSGDLKRADRVVVAGTLDSGFGAYAATISRAKLISSERVDGADPMGELRDDFSDKLATVMNDTETGLGMGILAGQKSTLDKSIQSAFVAASLTHILVASGYNLTVLVRFARRLFAKKSRLIALIFSVTFVALFVGITGLSASMSRALLVSVISLLLWYVGRKMHPVVLLTLVAIITIIIDPTQLFGDVGWYLSFGSFAGVIILAPLLNDLVKQNNSLIQVLIETASAQIVTIPIIALFMGNVSLVGLLTNILVLPLLPAAMALTFIAGLGSCVLPVSVAGIIAAPSKWLLDFIIGVAKWGATLPGASIEFRPSMNFTITYYVIVVLAMIALWRLTKHNFYADNVVE